MSNALQDFFDPGNFFHDTDADKLAREQWEWQKEKYDIEWQHQLDAYDWNKKMQEDEFNYQQALNDTVMRREDDAVQRRVADLKAAGLSPTLAAGSSASATPVHAGNVSQVSAPNYPAIGDNPRVAAAMFKQQMAKDNMALAMTLVGNIANISRTKAETEMIKAKTGEQDVVNKYLEDKLRAENAGKILDNDAKRMANSFNSLANPARLDEMRKGLDIMDKQLKILGWNEKIATHESLRQIYYDNKARFEAELAGQNVEIAKLRRENIDFDTAIKAYTLVYAAKHGVPISGMNQWQALYDLGTKLDELFKGKTSEEQWKDWQSDVMTNPYMPPF